MILFLPLIALAQTGTAWVQHAPSVNGAIQGSVQQMAGESATLNGGANITGDLLVPGLPPVQLNGTPTYAGTLQGSGASTPTNYTITLNTGASLRNVVRRTNPITLPVVASVPMPTGTTSITVSTAGQSINWSGLKNLTLNSNVGQFTVPAGTYGNLSAGGGSGFKLGVAGATQASVYNFQYLTLNGSSSLQVLGPVVINLANGFSANAPVGAASNPAWLTLNIKTGGFTLNSGCNFYGYLLAPSGTVIINAGTQLIGGVTSAYLTVNGNGLLKLQTPQSPNQSPLVSLIAPVNNSSFTSPASISLSATASDPDGSVTKVEFLKGTTKVGEDLTAPYSLALTGVMAGTYSYFARATDNSGATTDSSAVAVTVNNPNQPPTVTLTAPADGAPFTAPATITVKATSADSDGTIAHVDFYQGSILIGQDMSAPYEVATSTLSAGVYVFSAKAFDNLGAITTSGTATVTVVNPNLPPTVTITAPVDSTTYDDPAGFTVTAMASDPDGSVSKVGLFRNGVPIGEDLTPPFSFAVSPLPIGTYDFVARATDNGGFSTDSAPVRITVAHINDAPIATAQSQTTPEETPLTITLAGTDPDGDPLSYSITSQPANGTLAPTASPAVFIYTPNLNYNGPDSVTFKVNDGALDSAPATVSLTVTPMNDAPVSYPASVTLNENTSASFVLAASDVDSPSLTFSITSGPSHGTYTGTPPNVTYTPNANYSGQDDIVFRAFDGQSYSVPTAVSLTVLHVNQPPSVILTAPANSSVFTAPASFTLAATASDSDGTVAKVEFFQGAIKLGESTAAPYQLAVSSLPSGSYAFTAKATDNLGASNITAVTTILVNAPPVVTLASPIAGSVFTTPAAITLQATASDSDGTVTKVEFFNGATKLGESTTAPYQYSWTNVASGTYTLAAKVTDNLGTSATSAFVTVVANNPPTVGLVAPTAGATLAAPASLTVQATAADSDGTVAKVEFFQGATKLGETASAPYQFAISSLPFGSYSFTAKVTDNLGASTASSAVSITVNARPVANAQSVTTAENTPLTITLAGNDPEGSPLTYSIVDQPTHGTLAPAAPSAILTYTPASNYHGPDSFTFKVNDGTFDSAPVTVSINIQLTNQPPVVDAGPDQQIGINLGDHRNQVLLRGTVTDDGVPNPPGVVNSHWTQAGGPKSVLIDSPDSLATVVHFGPANQTPAYALHFSTLGDSVVIPAGQSFHPSPAFSWELWFKGDRVPTTTASGFSLMQTMMSAADSVSYEDYFLGFGSEVSPARTLTFVVDTPSGGAEANPVSYYPPGGFVNGVWYHVVATQDYTNKRTRLYVNGVLQASKTSSAKPIPRPMMVSFGRAADGVSSGGAFPGSIDEVRIYDRELTATEITAHYANGAGAFGEAGQGLAGGWHFDEGSGTKIINFSNPAHSATITGSPTWVSGHVPVGTGPNDRNGNYTFRLTADDGAATAFDEVKITVNNPPVANDQSVVAGENAATTLTLTASDLEGEPLTYTIVTPPAHGTLSAISNVASGNGAIVTYRPAAHFTGSDSFTFVANDGLVDSSPPARVAIQVQSVLPPQITLLSPPGGSVFTVGQSVAFASQASDPNPGGTVVKVEYFIDGNKVGESSVAPFAFTWTAADVGTHTVLAVATNNFGLKGYSEPGSGSAQVLSGLRWLLPVITQYNSTDGTCVNPAPVSRNLAGEPATIYNLSLRFRGLVEQVTCFGGTNDGAYWQVGGAPDGSAYNVYKLTISNPAQVYYINRGISGSNEVYPIDYTATVQAAGNATITLTADCVDGAEHVNWRGLIVPGLVDINQPYNGQFVQMDVVQDLTSNVRTITVQGAPPQALDQSVTTLENSALAITLSATQVNNAPLVFSVVGQPAHGTLSGTAPNLTYTPATKYFGTDSFTFKANDGTLQSEVAKVTINITKVDYPPVAVSQSVTMTESSVLAITLVATQANNDPLTYSHTQPSHGVLSGNGPNLTYVPAADYTGVDSFTFKASDGPIDSAPATVSINVVPIINTAPVVDAGPDQSIRKISQPAVLSGVVTDDNRPLPALLTVHWRLLSGPAGGVVTFQDVSSASTTATFSQNGSYTLELSADDSLEVTTDTMVVRVGMESETGTPTGLLAWWPGNQTTEDMVSGIFGTSVGLGYGAGKVSDAFSVAADGLMVVPARAGTNVAAKTDGFTIEFWMNAGGSADDAQDRRLLAWTDPGAGEKLRIFRSNHVDGVRFDDGVGHSIDLTGTAEGIWAHIAITYDKAAQTLKGYVNGVLQTNVTATSFVLATSGDLSVGGSPSLAQSYWFNGQLDEVSFFSRPLGETEISELYAAGLAGKVPDIRNMAPQVTASASGSPVVDGTAATLAATAVDDGLPNPPATLTYRWSKVTGPGNVTFASSTSLETSATFSAPGSYLLEIEVSDSALSSSAAVIVNVASTSPTITIVSPTNGAVVVANGPVGIKASVVLISGIITKVEYFDGATKLGERTAPDITGGSTYTFAAALALGVHDLSVKATTSDGASAVSLVNSITVTTYTGPSVTKLANPVADTRISAPTLVTGIVADSALTSWALNYRLKVTDGATVEPWIVLATGTGLIGSPEDGASAEVPGTLGTFDPTSLINGIYEIRLVMNTTASSISTTPRTVVVEGNMKVGAFSLAFEDMKVPVAGIPISIVRTYDSRDTRVGDFGPGWRLAVNNIRVQKNRHLGLGWHQTDPSGQLGLQFYYVEPVNERIVTVTMPDGESHRFRVGAYVKNPERTGDADNVYFPVPARIGLLKFYPMGDTTSTLEPLDSGNQLFNKIWLLGTGDQDLYAGDYLDGDPFPTEYNTSRFRLTTKDGTKYIVDEKLGLLKLEDLNGNTLVLNRDPQDRVTAIVSQQVAPDANSQTPDPITIVIHRDATGRVDYIRDLASKDLDYLYDASGRLASFTNRELNITQFKYENASFPYYLTKIIDPRGVTALRSEFDTNGKLVKQIDADNRETIFSRGIDATGRFEKVKDRLGKTTSFYYDERGNVTTKIDPLGAITTFSYYPDGDWVKFETDHYGNTKSMAYDSRGNVTVQTIGASLTEDPANPITGYTTRTTYNDRSAPTLITDPAGRVQKFTYDATTGNLLSNTAGFGGTAPATSTYHYNTDGTLDTVTDALGNVTSNTYDYSFSSLSYPGATKQTTVTVTDPAGAAGSDPSNASDTVLRTSRTIYDAQENMLATIATRTLPAGGTEDIVTKYIYDAENRLTATIMPDGKVSETRYTSFGQTDKSLLWKSVANYKSGNATLARVTSYGYDKRGNQTSTTYPDATSESSSLDLENRREWSQDRLGHRTYFKYDDVGRLRFTYAPDATPADLTDNPYTETVYDRTGRVTDTYNELRHQTTVTYYADGTPDAGRRKQSVQVLSTGNLTTSYQYDATGAVRFVTDPRGNTIETIYDDQGRPTTVKYPPALSGVEGATQSSTKYDILGRRVETTDQEGKSTRYRYDALGRLFEVRQYIDQTAAALDSGFGLSTLDSRLASTRYTYDELGHQLTQTDARANTTNYRYDNLGRRTSRILPDGTSTETLQYDEWGNLWKRTDFKGYTSTFTYDVLNRLKTKTADATHPSLIYSHAIARVEYDYDADGARTAARTYNATSVTPLYTETTPRDERGRLDSKTNALGTLDYDYYANGLLKDVVSSNTGGVNIGYRYDEANRLAYVDDASGSPSPISPLRTTSYSYNANGSLETVLTPNGVMHDYQYDKLNRLRTLSVTNTLGTLRSYTYALNPSGHRKTISESTGRTAGYQYDGLYRMTSETVAGATGQNGTIGYTLDKVGNREARASSVSSVLSTSNTFNSRDWLSGDTFDLNGNTTLSLGITLPDVYDFEDRLIIRNKPDGSSINFAYDADGLLRSKTVLDLSMNVLRTTQRLIDTNNLTGYAQVVEEYQTTSAGTTASTYTYGSDLISVGRTVPGEPSTKIHYFAYDSLGSVRALTDTTGNVTDTWDYDAFGNTTAHTGTTDNTYLYRGEQYDVDLGMYYLRARFYNQNTGRFWNQDSYEGSSGDSASLHKYLYANADPVGMFDPSGHYASNLSELTNATGESAYLDTRLISPSVQLGLRVGQTAAQAITTRAIAWLGSGLTVSTALVVGKAVDYLKKDKDRDPDYVYFLHGTSNSSYEGIDDNTAAPPNALVGNPNTDFGRGFYTFKEDEMGAVDTARMRASQIANRRGGDARVLRFRMKRLNWYSLRKNFIEPGIYWEYTVKTNYRGGSPDAYDVVYGPYAYPINPPTPNKPYQYKFEASGVQHLELVGLLP